MCKGYATGSGTITVHFYGGTGNAIKLLRTDMGINSSSSTVTLNIMKALLSMDQFKLLEDYGGKEVIRTIQQSLNSEYSSYVGIIPCDGIYGRAMNLALIKVLQAIEGYSVSDATGNFGDGTKAKLPILPNASQPDATKLFRKCLTCNGYSAGTSSTWDSALSNIVRQFQEQYLLPVTGNGDVNTWMSLLLSKGNPDRDALGCDCSAILDSKRAIALYKSGYRYVGRYLTGTVGYQEIPKNMTRSELDAIFSAGLRVFAIYQEGVPSPSRYTYSKGFQDARKAVNAARNLGISTGEIIYFAIDYDLMDGEISATALPYFRGIQDYINISYFKYLPGIYGSRNVCSVISDRELAHSSFVSDMSTGFSGNMGYPIPNNWAFDQFHEFMFYYSSGAFALDKNAVSGRYQGFDHVLPNSEMNVPTPSESDYKDAAQEVLNTLNLSVPPPMVFKLKSEYTLDMGPVSVTFEASDTAFFTNNPSIDWTSITVANGVFPITSVSLASTIFDSIDASIKADCGITSSTLTFELASAVQNGTVYYGMNLNTDGTLDIYYKCEKILWTSADGSEEYKVYVQIKYTFKTTFTPAPGAPEESFDYAQVFENIAIIAAAVVIIVGLVAAAVVAGSAGSATGLIPFIFALA